MGTYDHIQVSGKQPVLQNTAIGNINPLTFVRHYDNSSTKGDVTTEVYISSNGKVVEFEDARNLLEPLLKLLDL